MDRPRKLSSPEMKFILIFFTLFSTQSHADELNLGLSKEAKLYFSARNLNQNLEVNQHAVDMIFLANINAIAESGNFRFEAKPEIRVISGDNNRLSTNNPALIHLESPLRAWESRFHFGNPPDKTILYGDWEKLNLTFNYEQAELYFGRKIISLGVMKYFPVWNKFSRPLLGVTLIPIYYGSDGFGGRIQFDQWTIQANQLYYNLGNDRISTLQVIHYGEFADLHGMVGSWWNQTIFGLAISRDMLEATFNLEYFHYQNQFQLGFGFDRALNEKITLNIEALYQSEGAGSSLDYNPFLLSRFRNLQASFYSWIVAQIQIDSLWKGSAGGLTNWIDQGTALNLGITHSLSETLELSLDTLIAIAPQNAEFSTQAFQFNDGSKFGMPTQLVVHLDWTF